MTAGRAARSSAISATGVKSACGTRTNCPHRDASRYTTCSRSRADEGNNDPENLRVYCSACHALVNWVRTYFGHYHPADGQTDVEVAELSD